MLVVITSGAERFQAPDLGLNIVVSKSRCIRSLETFSSSVRWGELVGLRRKRVDLERDAVTVAEQLLEVNGAFSIGPPKSGAGRRTVTLPPVVVDALAEHLRHYTARSPEAFVFLSSQGRHLRRSNFNRRVWQPAIRAAGVDGLRVHDLRHTAGTLATAPAARCLR